LRGSEGLLSNEEKAAKRANKGLIISQIITGLFLVFTTSLAAYYNKDKDVLATQVSNLSDELIRSNNASKDFEYKLSVEKGRVTELESELEKEKRKTADEVNEALANENGVLKAENARLLNDNETLRNALQVDNETIPKEAVGWEGHYYMAYDYIMDWESAKVFCEMLGGHLVTITSSYEQYFLMDLIYEKQGFFSIGAMDEKQNGTFQWVTDEEFDYGYWHEGEPSNNVDENYLQMNFRELGRWNNSVGEPQKFVCEWE
jgi:hypothetical protein